MRLLSVSPSKRFEGVPSPRALPVLGHVHHINLEHPIQSMMELAAKHGPIFWLRMPMRDLLIVSGAKLVDELCDERRFRKSVHGPLVQLRPLAGNGLFTAETEDPMWGRAHRILIPAFGPQAMRESFDPMLDIADQLVSKWERFGPDAVHDVAAEMTQLTLDTIALAGFGYRFNSFYANEMHPFIESMVKTLAEAGARTQKLPLQAKLDLASQRMFDAEIAAMNRLVDTLIRARRSNSEGAPRDLLARMLEGRDPVTGEALDDENIRYQMVTFLIAGHETTSGLLSFVLYELLRNRAVLDKARDEVDRVLGDEVPRFEHIAKLTYIDQVLRETLRLWPTAPAFGVTPLARTRLSTGLELEPGDDLIVLTPTLHRDRSVWGHDVEAFRPERFAPDKRDAIPANAWKPFGSGARACIGRPFAMQEATLVLAMLLQRFDLHAPSDYKLEVKETLTLKPAGYTVRVSPRARRAHGARSLRSHTQSSEQVIRSNSATEATGSAPRHGAPMTVLFGSNTGSSEAFALRIADDAQRRGWTVKLSSMDDAVGELGTEGALVVVTASYNGLPPDNAGRFCAWLDELAPEALAGLRYAVFGCGHRDWTTTFQAVPARVDAALAKAGAQAIVERGAADGRGDFFGDFDAWMPSFATAADAAFNVTSTAAAAQPLYTVEALAQRAVSRADAEGFVSATVLESVELVDLRAPRARSKKHIVLALPEGLSWQCGDYLAVMAENPQALVDRALARFSIEPDALLRLSSERASAATLPVGRAITARELLSSWVELAQPATKKQVELLASLTRCPPERAALDAYAKDYAETVLVPRRSALDLLEESPACALTFAGFLELLAPMKPRLYSIASSPKVDPARAALTVAVLDVPAYSGRGRHQGIASTHLARLRVGERVRVSLRSPNTPFRPAAPATPMLMIAAGTGIAPFRGFLEERAAQQAAGERVAKSVLYFGCDHPDVDLLYRDELRALEARGLLELRATYCEAPEGARVYVRHRITEEAADVKAMIDAGATVYLCGDGAKMAPAVREALATALGSREALAQLEREGRFVADVFS
jgi:cytochrome P450/NADPH-cytochrome P450 reductase